MASATAEPLRKFPNDRLSSAVTGDRRGEQNENKNVFEFAPIMEMAAEALHGIQFVYAARISMRV